MASLKTLGLVHARRRKKEVQIKMSPVMPFTFNAIELCVVIIDEKLWTRAREVCKALEYDAKTSKTANIIRGYYSPENITQKYQICSENITQKYQICSVHQAIGQSIRKNTIFTLMRKVCTELLIVKSITKCKRLQDTLLQSVISSYSAAAYKQPEKRPSASH